MSYGAFLIPNNEPKKETNSDSFLDSVGKIKDKMMSGLKDGNLSFDNATTVLKNTADLISDNKDALKGKFCGIGLTQLLIDGKMTNKTALGYLTQGFPKALNQTAIAMGFQSVESLKTALQAENGVNVSTFITSFEHFGNALKEFNQKEEVRKNVEGFQVIEIDAVLSDSRSYNAETPDRRVQSGQSYQEYIHNLPNTFSIDCLLQNGKRYTPTDFESLILTIRDKKTPIDVILGDDRKRNCVITSFTPNRKDNDGLSYSVELKQIDVGNVDLINTYVDLPYEGLKYIDFLKNPMENSTKVGGYLFKSTQNPLENTDKLFFKDLLKF